MTDFIRTRSPMLDAALVALVVGLAAILGAWGFQIIGHYVPCKLCLEQRVAYYTGLPVFALAAILAWRGAAGPARLLLLVGAAIFVAGFGLATYHAGAEWGWWPGPSDCGDTGAGRVKSVTDLAAQLQGIKVVSCTEAPLRVLGLSFAGWNAAVSLFIAAVALYGATRKTAAV